MTPPAKNGRTALTVSREEEWVAHAALLAAIEAAVAGGDDAPDQMRALQSVERDRELCAYEIELLRDALVDYLGDAPVRDRAPGRSVLRRADDALGSPQEVQ